MQLQKQQEKICVIPLGLGNHLMTGNEIMMSMSNMEKRWKNYCIKSQSVFGLRR